MKHTIWMVGGVVGLAVLAGCGEAAVSENPVALREPGERQRLRASYVAGRQQEGAADPRYRVSESAAGVLTASSPSRGITARFDDVGAKLTATSEAWRLGLRPSEVDCGSIAYPVSSGAVSAKVSGPRADYARSVNDVSLTESYANGPLGLEQSFVLARSPCPADAKTLALRVELSGLSPVLREHGGAEEVELRDAGGALAARYTDLFAHDARGRALASRFSVGTRSVTLFVDISGASWPIVVDPLIWSGAGQDLGAAGPSYPGYVNAISGDTALVTDAAVLAPVPVSVFVRSGSTWNLQQGLERPDSADSEFGLSLAISGETALVKGGGDNAFLGIDPVGRVYVFVRTAAAFGLEQTLAPSDSTDNSFGSALALSGDTALIGSAMHGKAHVFERAGSVWTEQQVLDAGDLAPSEVFGDAVALDGDTALIGHKLETGERVVHVFVRSGSVWGEQQELTAPSGLFGVQLALSGDTALVAGYRKAAEPRDNGVAYVFVRSGNIWSIEQILTVSGAAQGGQGVALSGDKALITEGTSAYVFVRSGNTWLAHAEFADGDALNGVHPAISNDTAIVGWTRQTEDDLGFLVHNSVATAYGLYAENGACNDGADCVSGHCVENVCCDTACSDGCKSCLAARKAFGVDGVCGFVAQGTDPRGACPDDIATCNTGACDGHGACQLAEDETVCTPQYCDGHHEAYGRCGGGRCYPAHGFDCQLGYTCNEATGSCNSSCRTDEQCDTVHGWGCFARRCELKQGARCGQSADCSTGACVDGVCCESQCLGECNACSNALSGQPDGKCVVLPAGTVCARATCQAGVQTDAAMCDGVLASCDIHQTECGSSGCDGDTCGSPQPGKPSSGGQAGQPGEPNDGSQAGQPGEPNDGSQAGQPGEPSHGGSQATGASESPAANGCACRAAGDVGETSWPLVGVVMLGLLRRRRRSVGVDAAVRPSAVKRR